MMITINKMPSPYDKDGRLLTHSEYQKKCELIDKPNREVKELSEALVLMCKFAKPKDRLGGNFLN